MQRNAENNMTALNNALIEFPITQNRKSSSCFALQDWKVTDGIEESQNGDLTEEGAGGGGGTTEGVNSK